MIHRSVVCSAKPSPNSSLSGLPLAKSIACVSPGDGAMASRCNNARWCGARFARAARKRGDSGSHSAVIASSTSGKTPPMTKMTGQPKPWLSSNATT
jgi:hypothetical protein